MENRMDYSEFEPLFGKWAYKFKPFIESKEFFDIYQRLKADSLAGEKILPTPDRTFRTFQQSDPQNVKVVFLLMDPYPRLYKDKTPQATGIAMDCSNSPDGKLQPSLTYFYDAISREMEEKVQYSPSLQYLQDQGCLMLNTDLTVKYNKTGSHERLWEPFQKFFLQEVMGSYTGIIYVLCGKSSHRMDRYIMPLSNYIFKLDHPSSAQYGSEKWDSEGIFNKINDILLGNNGKETLILWNRVEFEQFVPF